MYSVDIRTQLKDFANAVAIPVGLTDSIKWPVRSGSVIFPVRNIMVHDFIDQVESSGIMGKPEEWRKAFDGATQIWRNSHHLINGLLDAQTDKGVVAQKILLLIEGVAALSNDHYFESLGNHLVLKNDDVIEVASVTEKIEKSYARKLLSLSGLLWAYSETNYFVAHELTCEYHGAYKLPNGVFMVVRDFKNLIPKELWCDRDYGGVPAYVRIVTIHDGSLQIQFDVYNNLYDEKGTLSRSLIGGYAIADGRNISESDISEMISIISSKVTSFTNEVNRMQEADLAHKYLEIFWYRKKSLSDYMGVDWKPAVELFDIQDQGLAAGQPKKTTQPKSMVARTPVEQLAIDFDFSNYIN